MSKHPAAWIGLAALFASGVCGGAEPPVAPEWIWSQSERAAGQERVLYKRFELEARPRRATLRGLADFTHAAFYVNEKRVGVREPYSDIAEVDVAEHLKTGANVIGVRCRSVDGPAALFVQLILEWDDGHTESIVTDQSWRAVRLEGDRLEWPALDQQQESPAATFGRVARFPWRETADSVTVRPLDDYTQWKEAQGTVAGTDPATFQLLPGFEIELLRSAQEGEDSWVAMAFDPEGRLIVAKEKRGLLRFTLPAKSGGEAIKVETIDDTLQECRGLLFAHGALYAMANNDKGLYRLRDTTGDGRLDDVRLLKQFDGDVGHGRNQIALGPDGMIYGIFGDAVFEPEGAHALPPALSNPTAAEKTRSGYLARSKEGKQWEVVVRGLRNPFGVAFNGDGEAFTYDADAEYDMGAPWYRPTRVDHLISGADFGWRRVTKEWPPYVPDRPDMPQPTLDIGKGSPTAVVFGTGSNFPPPYNAALFILDWAYGRVLAVHLEPRGSSYAAKAESFVRGRPANVTDVEFGPDGAMYFVTGGRGTQSALYRVRYTGPPVQSLAETKQQRARRKHAAASRKVRKDLEAFHGVEKPAALAKAWPHLSSDDPWIRHAARVAVESQPVREWGGNAEKGNDRDTALQALLALVRVGPADAHASIVQRLNALSFVRLTEQQKLTALFIYDRCLMDGDVARDLRDAVVEQLDAHYPDSSWQVNRRLSLLMKRLDAPRFVERTLPLLARAEDQEERMHYLFVLRDVKNGWSAEARQNYFDELRRLDDFVGGEGMPEFRRLIETEALAAVPPGERKRLEEMLRAAVDPWIAQIPQEERAFVQKWQAADLENSLDALKSGRNFENGERMFAAAKCIGCHRVGNRGGVIGPDLTSAASRYRPADLLISIVDPSRVVSEKYRNEIFVLKDGRTVTGRLVPGGDYRAATLRVIEETLKPDEYVEFAKSAVEMHKPSPVSPMPAGLLDRLTREEILDLLAYVNAAGEAGHPGFGRAPKP